MRFSLLLADRPTSCVSSSSSLHIVASAERQSTVVIVQDESSRFESCFKACLAATFYCTLMQRSTIARAIKAILFALLAA